MADYRNQQIENTDGSGTINRGLANNNPGDIKYDGTSWQGMTGNDGTFVTFADTTWGIRAMAVDLTTKINKDGLTNISEIINVYAPPSENDTASYINAVVADTDFGATETLTADQNTLGQLIRAIINHEIGDSLSAEYVSDADIQQGVSMASGGAVQLVQAAVVAVANNTDNAAIIAGGALLLGAFLIYKSRKKK
jgi:LPXTG-motif cell wall-anchored protein